MFPSQQPRCFRRLSAGIFDVLGFVEDDVIENDVLEIGRIAA